MHLPHPASLSPARLAARSLLSPPHQPMSLFTLHTLLGGQPFSRDLRSSRPLWSTLGAFDAILSDLEASAQEHRIDLTTREETDTAYVHTIELPGFKRDQVTVQVEEEGLSLRTILFNGVTVTAERDDRKVTRTITLPTDADSTKIEAKLEDGILTVTVAKVAKPTPPAPRKVTVN